MKRIQDPLNWSELKLAWENERRKKQTATPKETRVALNNPINWVPEKLCLCEHLPEMGCPFYTFNSCRLNASLHHNHSNVFDIMGFIWYKLYAFNQYSKL